MTYELKLAFFVVKFEIFLLYILNNKKMSHIFHKIQCSFKYVVRLSLKSAWVAIALLSLACLERAFKEQQ